jgi:hypothetical protein
LSARKLKPYGIKSAACEDATQPSTVRRMIAGMSAAAAAGGCHTAAIAQMAAATPKRAGGIRDRRKFFLISDAPSYCIATTGSYSSAQKKRPEGRLWRDADRFGR